MPQDELWQLVESSAQVSPVSPADRLDFEYAKAMPGSTPHRTKAFRRSRTPCGSNMSRSRKPSAKRPQGQGRPQPQTHGTSHQNPIMVFSADPNAVKSQPLSVPQLEIAPFLSIDYVHNRRMVYGFAPASTDCQSVAARDAKPTACPRSLRAATISMLRSLIPRTTQNLSPPCFSMALRGSVLIFTCTR